MNNNKNFEEAVAQFHTLSTQQKAGAFSYLTGALESLFRNNKVSSDNVADAYLNSVEHAKKYYSN